MRGKGSHPKPQVNQLQEVFYHEGSLQVSTLKNQIAACLRLIALRVKSAILRLLKLENQLEEAMTKQFSEEKIKSTFTEVGGDWREWVPAFYQIIPQLRGLNLTGNESYWLWVEKYPEEMKVFDAIADDITDWQMSLCIMAAKKL